MVYQYSDGTYTIANDHGDTMTVNHSGSYVLVKIKGPHGGDRGSVMVDLTELVQTVKAVRDSYVEQLSGLQEDR